MTFRATIFVAAALVACHVPSAAPPHAPDSDWLVGVWLETEGAEDRSLVACASGLPIAYRRDNRYDLFEVSGTWRLAGDQLVETETTSNDVADPADLDLGRPVTSRIERVSANEMRKIYSNGTAVTLLRCPDAD